MIKLALKYINDNNYFPDSIDFNEYYLSHPDYPSLYAITETLSFFGVENGVTNIVAERYQNLPDYFLTLINTNDGEEFVYVTSKQEKYITFLTENKYTKTISKDEFLDAWTGIILIVDKNTVETIVNNNKSSWFVFFYFFLVLLLYSKIFFDFSWILFAYTSLSLFGLYLSILILREKFNLSDFLTSKICSNKRAEKSNCQIVFDTVGSKIYKDYSLLDICLIFFITLSLITILSSVSIAFFIPVSFLSLPIVLYSIWYQKYKIRKLCPLCIGICITLISITLLTFFQLNTVSLKAITSSTLFFMLILFLTTSVWVKLKPIIDGYFKLKISDRENKRFKLNINIFKLLWLNSEEIDKEHLKEIKKLEFGNRNSTLELSFFLSPSCKHCFKTYEESYKLLKEFTNDLKLSIYFNIEKEEDDFSKIALIITETFLSKNENEAIFLLNDWFINKTSLRNFIKKYDLKITQQTRDIILNQTNWSKANELNYTPLRILNNHIIPNEYSINELRYFIPDLLD